MRPSQIPVTAAHLALGDDRRAHAVAGDLIDQLSMRIQRTLSGPAKLEVTADGDELPVAGTYGGGMCECDGQGRARLGRRQALALAGSGLAALLAGCGRLAAGAPGHLDRPHDRHDPDDVHDLDGLEAQRLVEVEASKPLDTVSVLPGLTIVPRAAWGGDLAPRGPLLDEDVRFLLVHHSATSNAYTAASVPALLRNAYAFHTGPAKGWPDICYHFFVDRYGGVWEGRTGSLERPIQASATGGSQGFAQLVCVLGDFTSVLPTAAALHSLTQLLTWLGGAYALDTRPGATTSFVSRGSQRWAAGTPVTTTTIAGHRDMSYTGCPGELLYRVVRSDLPTAVTAQRQAIEAAATQTAGPFQEAVRIPATSRP